MAVEPDPVAVVTAKPPPAWAFRALILLAPAVLMVRALAPGHGLGGGDLELIFYPFWDYLGHSLRHGRLPLWDPDLGAGLPFLASAQSQALYPPVDLLVTLLPLHAAAFVFCFGHLYFAGFGTERLARKLGWSDSSAACAGALAACAPMLLSSVVCPNRLAAVAWLPWTMLAAERVVARRRGGIAALAVCVGMGLLCAQPEVTLLGAIGVGTYAFFRMLRGDRGAVPLCLLGGVLGVGLAAAELLPLAELLRQSDRGLEVAGIESAWSLGRGDFASLFLPFLSFNAPAHTFEEMVYGPYQTLISELYLGVPAVLLGLVALRRGSGRERLMFLVAALALLMGAYGGQASELLGRLHVGLVSWRYSIKFIFPAAFAVALLAARGAEEVAGEELGSWTGRALTIAGGALVLGAVVGLRWFRPSVGVSMAWVGASLWGLAAVLTWVPRGSWRQWALVAFCVTDASLCALRIPFEERASQCAGLFEAAKHRAGEGRIDAMSGVPIPNRFGFTLGEPGWQNHCLEGNIATEFGVHSALFYGTPAPKGCEVLVGRFGAVGEALLGVTLILRGHAEELTGVVPVSAPELAPLWVAEVPGAAPRVELRPTARVVGDMGEALGHETLAQARQEVLLDMEPPPPSASGEPYAGSDLAQLVADSGEQVEITTASSGERYLVLADLYYRGWTATVDGQPAPIRVAYGMLRTVRLGPGRHRVVFDYHPESFRRGLWITLLTAAALAIGTLARRSR